MIRNIVVRNVVLHKAVEVNGHFVAAFKKEEKQTYRLRNFVYFQVSLPRFGKSLHVDFVEHVCEALRRSWPGGGRRCPDPHGGGGIEAPDAAV